MARALIETPRLRLEPFSDAHLTPRYVSWLNDPAIVRFSDQRFTQHTLESCRAYLQSFEGTSNYFWAIVTSDGASAHIGNLNAYCDTHHRVADVGILLGERQQHGRGYATEAWLGACDYLLRMADLRKVTAGTISVNTPMLRLFDRVEMEPDGRRLRQQVVEEQEVDVIYTALYRERWLMRHPNGPFV